MKIIVVSALCSLYNISSVVFLCMVVANAAHASSIIPDSAHDDWIGDVSTSTTSDGSMLHEFVAHTLSGNRAGAVLAVSFVPRFKCEPLISFIVAKSDVPGSVHDTQILIAIDAREIAFSTLSDEDNELVRFSYQSDVAQSRTLRNLLDVGSRLTLSLQALNDSGPESSLETENSALKSDISAIPAADMINFSLLGSRKAVLATEQACMNHEPPPYTVQKD